MIMFKRGDIENYGLIALFLAIVIAIGGVGTIAQSAIRTEKYYETTQDGVKIYLAPDDNLPPNPKTEDGYYYFVEGQWAHAYDNLEGAKTLATRVSVIIADLEETYPSLDGVIQVHFTVQKKITTHESTTTTTDTYEPLEGVTVDILQSGSEAVYETGTTDSDGVIVFSLPNGEYSYHVVSGTYEKYPNSDQQWTEVGVIYYKKINLIREEVFSDGNTEDTTPETPDPNPTDSTENTQTVAEFPEDEESIVTWDAPWVEGGGNAQLEGGYDEHVDAKDYRLYVAVGVIGLTGTIMLIASQFFMTKRR